MTQQCEERGRTTKPSQSVVSATIRRCCIHPACEMELSMAEKGTTHSRLLQALRPPLLPSTHPPPRTPQSSCSPPSSPRQMHCVCCTKGGLGAADMEGVSAHSPPPMNTPAPSTSGSLRCFFFFFFQLARSQSEGGCTRRARRLQIEWVCLSFVPTPADSGGTEAERANRAVDPHHDHLASLNKAEARLSASWAKFLFREPLQSFSFFR